MAAADAAGADPDGCGGGIVYVMVVFVVTPPAAAEEAEVVWAGGADDGCCSDSSIGVAAATGYSASSASWDGALGMSSLGREPSRLQGAGNEG